MNSPAEGTFSIQFQRLGNGGIIRITSRLAFLVGFAFSTKVGEFEFFLGFADDDFVSDFFDFGFGNFVSLEVHRLSGDRFALMIFHNDFVF